MMGLDIGHKHIGVALTDQNNKMAYPEGVFCHDSQIRDTIKKIIQEKNIGKIVVGIPFSLKGEIGHQAQKVFDFIHETLEGLGPEIVHYDERFTSKIPKMQNRGKKMKEVDKYSACILLNDYISHHEK